MADNETEAVTALNSAFVQDGAVVYIPSGVKAEKPFVLDFGYSSDEVQQMCFTRALVLAGESSKADVVICHRDNGNTAILVDFVKETLAVENSEVNISELSMQGSRSAVIDGSYVRLAAV